MTPYINGQPKVLYSLGRCVPGGRLRPCHTRLPQSRAPAPPRPGPRLLRVVSAGRSGGAEAPVLGRRGRGIRAGQQPPCGPEASRPQSSCGPRPLALLAAAAAPRVARGRHRPGSRGAAAGGAGRGGGVSGSLAQNLSFVFPQLDANSLTKPGNAPLQH